MGIEQRAHVASLFTEAEASLRLEGMDPVGDPIYENAKRRVLAGELTLEAARALMLEQSAPVVAAA